MKVCIVVTEFFGWGTFGGFGRLSRTIATNLAKRNIETHVLMQKSWVEHQPDYSLVDGVHVHAFDGRLQTRLGFDSAAKKLARQIGADVYHSEEVNIWSFYVQQGANHAKHIITCQDPEIGEPWERWRKSPLFLMSAKRLREMRELVLGVIYNWMKRKAMQKADLVCSQTKYHVPLIKQTFGLNYTPIFLPNPVEVPNHKLHKNNKPTILFLARWDPIKRPWIFFRIAKKMPHVHFICAGKSHSQVLDAKLRNRAAKIPNLECPGHVDPKEVLEKSWILVNCSVKESLPVSFLEACAYKCAIVSCNDPDGFASRFGVFVHNGEDVDEYAAALNSLISDENKLTALGQSAYDYVKETHQLDTVIDKHLKIYRRLLN